MTVSIDSGAEQFLYDQVSTHIRQLVEAGTLKPGDKAPSLRRLSRQLKVSITTVRQAYGGLADQGILQVRPQSGFYVNGLLNAPNLPKKSTTSRTPRKVRFGQLFEEIFMLANDPGIAPLGAAVPSMELMPVKGLARATGRVLARDPEAAMNYCFPPGDRALRRAIARRYVDQGMSVDPDDVIVTSGATEALAFSLQAVARPGDIVAVESPTYFSFLRLLERMGILAVELDTDPETGICLDALANVIDTMHIKAVVAVPNFSNPVGSMMPEESKRAMVEMLEGQGIPLIEDDVYGDLYFDDQRPSVAKRYERRGGVITCSSFSKTVSPGYRVGWVMADRRYREDILEWKQATSSATSSLSQLALADYLNSGEYDRHLVRLRKAYREQVEKMRFMIAQHFPADTRVSDPRGGFVLWVELPRGVDSIEVFNRALEKEISVTPGLMFSSTRRYRNFIRVSCGHPWTGEIERAVIGLAEIVREY